MRVFPLWPGPGKGESAALLACWLTTSGCVPSHRLVHQGDRYFERCFGADFDADVAGTQKEACWQAWITYYTKHQPAHRVDYALARIESLQNGDPPPTLPGLAPTPSQAPAVEARGFSAREQNQNEDADAGASGVSAATRVTLTPDAGPVPHGCLHFCNEYESSCNARCDRGSLACSASCEHERGVCLRGCY